MRELLNRVAGALGAELGEIVEIRGHQPLGGGCINGAARLDTSEGPYFLKHQAAVIPGLFSGEAAGLEALWRAAPSLRVPRPIVFEDPAASQAGFLVTDFVEPGRRGPDFDEALGRGLAELHAASADRFGFEIDTYCGATPQPNRWTNRWLDFYREHRLRHLLTLGRKRGAYDRTTVGIFERLFDRLDERLADDTNPALIHGDLWSGNLLSDSEGAPALIDPAVYYGHREAELGMMTLFEGFSERTYAAYRENAPLDHDWRDRTPLYQLYHLMNHAVLFGGSYVTQSIAVAKRFA